MRNGITASLLVATLVLAGCTAGGGGNVGLSAGGAADTTNFRTNVEEGYLPQPSDVTHEGLFYDHSFDLGTPERCEQLFCPTVQRATSRDPLSGETERYLAVGLESNRSLERFDRKRLNLVVVVDVSGSMDESFASYYYDDGERVETEGRRKMAAARDAVSGLLDQLRPGDRVAVVAFSDSARTVAEMRRVGEGLEPVRSAVRSLEAGGGTNLAAGMDRARRLLAPYTDADPTEVENRVVYVTDAQPNVDAGADGLGSRLAADAADGVHSTFVGVGVDFNSRLVETIGDVRGANYYTVRSAEEFAARLGEEFEYMVTLLAYDVSLAVESDGWELAAVYGTGADVGATGEVLKVTTLFAAPTENRSTRGGVVLVRLRRVGNGDRVTLRASYETRTGDRQTVTREVRVGDRSPPAYASPAARKAVVLARQATLLSNWAAYERARLDGGEVARPPSGIEPADYAARADGWEQESLELTVSDTYEPRLRAFLSYLRAENAALGGALDREVALFETVLAAADGESTATPTVEGEEDTATPSAETG